MKNFIPNKAHGWEGISIRLIRLCSKSIAFHIKLLLQFSKKSNVVPVQKKKENKNFIKNYQPIKVFPVFSKVYERLIFSSIFN